MASLAASCSAATAVHQPRLSILKETKKEDLQKKYPELSPSQGRLVIDQMNDEKTKDLATMILCDRGKYATVERLELHGNVGDAGATALAEACAKGALTSLKELNLNRNQIGDAGATALADACAKGALAQLTVLSISNNQIGDPGLTSLADACAKGALANLTTLYLIDNQIGDAGCTALADACAKGALPNLTYLYIHLYNPASQSAKKAVQDAINNRK